MAGGLFVFMPLGSIAERDSVFASLSRPRPVSTGRLPLTALAETRRAGLSCLYGPRDVLAELPCNGIHISELLFGARAFPVAFPRYL